MGAVSEFRPFVDTDTIAHLSGEATMPLFWSNGFSCRSGGTHQLERVTGLVAVPAAVVIGWFHNN